MFDDNIFSTINVERRSNELKLEFQERLYGEDDVYVEKNEYKQNNRKGEISQGEKTIYAGAWRFTHSFKECSLSSYYVLDSVIDAED